MVSLNPPVCDFGWKAPDFELLGVDGKRHTLQDCMGEHGLLVMFICNHCPYVKAIKTRLVADCRALLQHGVRSVAISSNDVVNFPDDSYPRMQEESRLHDFPFSYLWDETQTVAKAYGAVCTPDFFGFNKHFALQYRGRFDAAGRNPPPADNPHDLLDAMVEIAKTGNGPKVQIPSIGCSIKWFEDAQ